MNKLILQEINDWAVLDLDEFSNITPQDNNCDNNCDYDRIMFQKINITKNNILDQ